MRIFIVLLLFVIPLQAEESAPIKTGRDVTYASYDGRELLLDWYRPDTDAILPGVVVLHGGGWIGGTRKGFVKIAEDLANAGFVVANIEYRLATEEKFPGAVLDVKAAVRWMRSNVEMLGVDPDHIGGVGGSAGGHLTAMVASTGDNPDFSKEMNHPEQSDTLQAAVIMGAGVDQVARVKETKSGSIRNCAIFFGGEYSEVPEVYAAGSPITHVSETTCPILMLDGEFDRPGQRYGEYRRKLDAAGVRNEFKMVPGAKHGEWGKAAFRPGFVSAMVTFLDSTLK